MILGGYREGREELPRVFKLSVARLVVASEQERFLVSIHEEGTAVTWQHRVKLESSLLSSLQTGSDALKLWSLNQALTVKQATQTAQRLGKQLYKCFIGRKGAEYLHHALGDARATAFLLDLDETVQGWPWELLLAPSEPLALQVPVGRLVRTGLIPKAGRDPTREDDTVRLLAVMDSRADLAAAHAEVEMLKGLEHSGVPTQVTVLEGAEATKAKVLEHLQAGTWDILHVAGHARFESQRPGQSALMLADGPVTADDILAWSWQSPLYLVFNSSCEAGRSRTGHGLVSRQGHANGLASAFLTAGVQGYLGFFWPVNDASAALFTHVFYESLFRLKNVGHALLEARQRTQHEVSQFGDLAAFSAVYFGDAGGKARRDLATAN
jgi:CHAT domain-containing protein